ncbi:DUF4913 domain-containing protein [Nocardia thailandica]|uniref:DUF4913 domain-containing protein n=1 Tax=Nocardia thailandica TaxID=257275 RepID=A0ABW6PXN6_9NOCA
MTTTENTDNTTAEADLAEQAAAVMGGADLTAALSSAVRKAVSGQVTAVAKDIASGAIAEFLTDEVVATMRETALLEAEAAVNPDSAAAVAAAAEPAAAQEEKEEEPRKLHYARLDLFVENYLAHNFRREVSAQGSDRKLRWCPQWWDHGEVVSRLEALWMAWEQLRLGEGPELATWWIQYVDPTMAVLLDTEGPFKYCSAADGHRPKMLKLPTIPAPEGWFVDGHAHDNPEPSAVSGIVLPRPATGRSQIVLAIEDFGE